MVGDVTGYGGWRNSCEVVNMNHFDNKNRINYAKKLWEKDPEIFNEWKEWCKRLENLKDFFIFSLNDNNIPLKNSYQISNKHIIIYLKNNNGSYEEVNNSSATHILEQIFDDDGNIVQENLKLKI